MAEPTLSERIDVVWEKMVSWEEKISDLAMEVEEIEDDLLAAKEEAFKKLFEKRTESMRQGIENYYKREMDTFRSKLVEEYDLKLIKEKRRLEMEYREKEGKLAMMEVQHQKSLIVKELKAKGIDPWF